MCSSGVCLENAGSNLAHVISFFFFFLSPGPFYTVLSIKCIYFLLDFLFVCLFVFISIIYGLKFQEYGIYFNPLVVGCFIFHMCSREW